MKNSAMHKTSSCRYTTLVEHGMEVTVTGPLEWVDENGVLLDSIHNNSGRCSRERELA